MMKIQYGLMAVCVACLLSACEEEKPETVFLQHEEDALEVTAVTPQAGHVGDRFSVSGNNLGASASLMKVYIGDFAAETVTCSETKVIANVPEEAISGKIFLEFLDEKIATDFAFTVWDDPTFSSESALEGYAGSEVKLVGVNMPATDDNLTLWVGDEKVSMLNYEADDNRNGTLSFQIPEKAPAGKTDLMVYLYDRKVYKGSYKVIPTPIVNALGNGFLRLGKELVITGSGLLDFQDKVTVDFAGVSVTPESLTHSEIRVIVPETFEGGMVTVILKDYNTYEVGDMQPLQDGDVTGIVLKNCAPPFAMNADYVAGAEWGVPAEWIYNSEFKGESILFTDDCPEGLITLQAGWGQANKQNGMMYQTVALPKGKYTFTLNVEECRSNKGRFGVIFAVTKGNATLPTLSDQINGPHKYTWWFEDESNVLAYYRITDRKEPHTEDVVLELDEVMEVTIGFITQLNGEGTVKLSSIAVTLE